MQLCTWTEASERWVVWTGKTEDEKTQCEKEEKIWWTRMLQKAHVTQGMKYPRTGIIGKKHSVDTKALYLTSFLEKQRENDQGIHLRIPLENVWSSTSMDS